MSVFKTLRRLFSPPPPAAGSAPASRSTKSQPELFPDAEKILRAAIAAVDPGRLVAQTLQARAPELTEYERIWLVGFGKASASMARGAHQALGTRIAGGVLNVPLGDEGSAPAGLDAFGVGHPVPDQAGVAGARAIRQLVREAGESDLVICLISGGGSAMLPLPPDGMPIEAVQDVTEFLMRAGATIGDLNCVRKHLDLLKGGRLAREAAPARVLGLALSDVVGDELDVIASGPLTPDTTRFADAVAVLRRYDVWNRAPLAVRGYLDLGVKGETPEGPRKNDPCFERVEVEVVGNSRVAAQAACGEAERLGYTTQLLTSTLTGEAREAGKFLAETAREIRNSGGGEVEPTCVVTAGETVVTVRGDGHGGRNLELVLGAASGIDGLGSVLVASMGTDGIDGATNAAGALATGDTLRRARSAGLDWEQALERNDSYPFFEVLDDLIVSGPTGTNVADIQVLLLGS